MPPRIPEHLLSALSTTVESILGLNFPRDRWNDLNRALTKCAPTLGFDDPHTCVRWLLDVPVNEDRIEALAEYLTVAFCQNAQVQYTENPPVGPRSD